MAYYAGIEGGTTGSRMVILSAEGKQLGQSEGPHTNYWHLGMEEAARRVVMLADDALKAAGLPKETPFKALGLALSGVNTESNCLQIIEAVRKIRPGIAEKIHACNDAVGTLVTATDEDAIVLIAGTGSICKLIRKNLSFVRIGGLGYLLGDEGSAFWIAHQAIMTYIKTTEGLYHDQFGTKMLTEAIYKHFNISHHHELLPHFHENINKTFIAQLCKPIAEAAREGDLVCKQIFFEAGLHLGRHVSAAVRNADKEGLITPEGMDVICCGSVFKSWDLLETGFRAGVQPRHLSDCRKGRLHLRLLQTTAAFGAAIVAAKVELGIQIPRPENVTKLMCDIVMSEEDPQRHL
ncbi:N-acetyl-D-glucosamine kinase [Clonorchis sinensis]|uniref:N-acetyl-D-glucosamine kinase n=2 Tax=Clonorchis sinensis TaxID=79923 RepID=H2KQH9_CLOSI|nr:N-acetyl-D-glucosamine kinase [Clonorchis sinensis]GAA38326.2 N-acetylglucosamine kinase [Clonorchis sinensis]